MSLQGVQKICLKSHSIKRVDVIFSQTLLSSDGGLLTVREMDEKIGLTAKFAAARHDARGDTARHSNLSMTQQRVV